MSLCEPTPWVLAASMRVGAALKDGACGAKKRNVIGQPPWSSCASRPPHRPPPAPPRAAKTTRRPVNARPASIARGASSTTMSVAHYISVALIIHAGFSTVHFKGLVHDAELVPPVDVVIEVCVRAPRLTRAKRARAGRRVFPPRAGRVSARDVLVGVLAAGAEARPRGPGRVARVPGRRLPLRRVRHGPPPGQGAGRAAARARPGAGLAPP